MVVFVLVDFALSKCRCVKMWLRQCVAVSLSRSLPPPDPVRLDLRAPDTLGEQDAQRIYDLLKGNMHDMYVEAGWGWDEGEKWREMKHRDARFLIARCGGGDVEDSGLGSNEGRRVEFQNGSANGHGSSSSSSSGGGGLDNSKCGGGVNTATDINSGSSRDAIGAPTDDTTGSDSPTTAIDREKKSGGEVEHGEAGAKVGDNICGENEGNATAQGEEGVSKNGERGEASTCAAATAAEEEERLAGYCGFRFAWDQDENDDGEGVGGKEDVLYVYELQVAPWAKRRGLGRRMMQALEVRQQMNFCSQYCMILLCTTVTGGHAASNM